MSVDVLVLLFVLFSVASSIFKKIQERAQGNQRPTPRVPEFEEPEADDFDLSEWDVFREEPTPGAEMPPTTTVATPEFREVRATRDVEEPRGAIEEFDEIRGARPVEEPAGSLLEYEVVAGRRSVGAEAPGELRIGREARSARSARQATTRKRRRRIRLKLNPQSVREGILYSEILGPPRADRVLW